VGAMAEHRITQASFPPFRSAQPARVTCSCEAVIELQPDMAYPDPHDNLREAWLSHRRDAGISERSHTLGTGPVGFSMGIRRKSVAS